MSEIGECRIQGQVAGQPETGPARFTGIIAVPLRNNRIDCTVILPMRLRLISLSVIALAVSACAEAASAPLSFNRDIRPILSDQCFRCHGADKSSRKGKMRLDLREEALAKEAFVPGKPDESELVKRIYTTNEDDVMPPADSHKTLTVAQKDLLKRWIAEGANYEPHWSFIKPVRPELPKVSERNWVNNPIDTFVLATLEGKKIKPSPEADRRTLLRRLSLDLTGLPPTPGEVASFVQDKSADRLRQAGGASARLAAFR